MGRNERRAELRSEIETAAREGRFSRVFQMRLDRFTVGTASQVVFRRAIFF
jgi:hypothetical protein